MGEASAVRVRLEPPTMRRAVSFLAAALRSRRLHGRWTRAPATREQYQAFVRRARDPGFAGHLVCTEQGEPLEPDDDFTA